MNARPDTQERVSDALGSLPEVTPSRNSAARRIRRSPSTALMCGPVSPVRLEHIDRDPLLYFDDVHLRCARWGKWNSMCRATTGADTARRPKKRIEEPVAAGSRTCTIAKPPRRALRRGGSASGYRPSDDGEGRGFNEDVPRGHPERLGSNEKAQGASDSGRSPATLAGNLHRAESGMINFDA